MDKHNKRSNKWIWLAVLLLFIFVAMTISILVSRMTGYLLDDTGAIELNQEDDSENQEENKDNSNGNEQNANPANKPNPGFEAEDDKTKWSTNTEIDIFQVSYVNGENEIKVKSDRGDKVIAPGTENTYTFKFKNTGNVALDYVLEVDAYITPSDVQIPITVRINRYDGKWITGGREEYVGVSALDQTEDSSTIGAGRYVYYTLDWIWPFENGNDELDTLLGDRATEEDLTFTIVLRTTATESEDPNATGGVTPQTGDHTSVALWAGLLIASFFMIIFFIFSRDKDEKKEE